MTQVRRGRLRQPQPCTLRLWTHSETRPVLGLRRGRAVSLRVRELSTSTPAPRSPGPRADAQRGRSSRLPRVQRDMVFSRVEGYGMTLYSILIEKICPLNTELERTGLFSRTGAGILPAPAQTSGRSSRHTPHVLDGLCHLTSLPAGSGT